MTNSSRLSNIRSPAVAGIFYPGNQQELAESVQHYLDTAQKLFGPAESVPKAIIAPHAGYIYSGLTASAVYQRLRSAQRVIKRVVILGPCHKVGVKGIALPSATIFNTPLGDVHLDTLTIEQLKHLPSIQINNDTHIDDHSIEVHLPFLQEVLEDFRIIPLIVGDADPDEVATVIHFLWGEEETLILVSSDLSHYLNYDSAKILDDQTRQSIEEMNVTAIGQDQACGRNAIKGLLTVAKEKGLSAKTADIRNSGDTAGTKMRVVGYGSWYFEKKLEEKVLEKETLTKTADDFIVLYQETMLKAAASAILGALLPIEFQAKPLSSYNSKLKEPRASFVTLNFEGKLRGCIGSIQAFQPLINDIIENAYKAAFEDPRFQKLTLQEIKTRKVELSISILSPQEEVKFSNEVDLLKQIQPAKDGLILSEGNLHRGVFLPTVWEKINGPRQFINELKLKAGLSQDYWSESIRVWRFSSHIISSQDYSPEKIWRL